jgi:hypothetical protein
MLAENGMVSFDSLRLERFSSQSTIGFEPLKLG